MGLRKVCLLLLVRAMKLSAPSKASGNVSLSMSMIGREYFHLEVMDFSPVVYLTQITAFVENNVNIRLPALSLLIVYDSVV